MSKIKNTNSSMINVLNQNIKKELNSLDEVVRVQNLYGIFLNDNTFIIAKENSKKLEYCTTYTLENFFTGRLITYSVIEDRSELQVSWKNSKIFMTNSDSHAIAVPIRKLLNKYIQNGVTTKRNIDVLFETTNEYIKEHPNFATSLFIETMRKR